MGPLIRTKTAGGTIGQNLIAKYSGTSVVLATAGADLSIGVLDTPNGVVNGERCDVVLAGLTKVRLGGTVAAGAKVMPDASGRAITAAASAGVNVSVVGVVQQSGVIDDIVEMLVAPSVFQG